MNDRIVDPASRLYYKDSHLSRFTAMVTDCREYKDGYAVTLSETAFFPEGGGQPADTGYIGSVRVKDVREREGEILHLTDAAVEIGERVDCALDWEQRYRRMQNHSGEHTVSGIAHSTYGCENVGFHMGRDFMTIDFDRELDEEQLADIETRANAAVRENIPIRAWFPSGEELTALEYRAKLELTENVRIVDIPGVDRCACCAPHVSATGEIGLIKLIDSQRHRGGLRITLVCGMDALDYVRRIQRCNTAVSNLLSAKREETGEAVERVLQEQQRMKERIAALSRELAYLRAEGVEETEGNICLFDSVLDEVGQRELVNLLMEKCSGIAGVFCGGDDSGYRYIIGSRSADLRKLSRSLNEGIGGKGGGRPEMIQGQSTFSREKVELFFKNFNI